MDRLLDPAKLEKLRDSGTTPKRPALGIDDDTDAGSSRTGYPRSTMGLRSTRQGACYGINPSSCKPALERAMTAEVAVMNKTAVALAADSAVTIKMSSGFKIYNTANKLFTLSKFAPVGVLVYNNAEINSVPAEIIVKEFREQLGSKRFNALDDYGAAFLEFLQHGSPMTEASKERNFYL